MVIKGIAAYALIYNRAKRPIAKWSKNDDFDAVILAGNVFYKHCLQNVEREINDDDDYLEVGDVLNVETMIGRKTCCLSFYNDDLIDNWRQKSIKFENMAINLKEFSNSKCTDLLLTLRGYSFGITRDEHSFYFIDSHSRNQKGQSIKNGQAVVMQFDGSEAIQNLAEHIINQFTNLESDNYSICFLKIKTK